MAALDAVMYLMQYGGLVGAVVFGAIAAHRRTAGWLLLSSFALLVVSVPLLLGGIGVFGIAAAVILAGVARAMPGYARYRWVARAVAVAAAAGVLALQVSGWRRGNGPSAVDRALVVLAVSFVGIAFAPIRPGAASDARGGSSR